MILARLSFIGPYITLGSSYCAWTALVVESVTLWKLHLKPEHLAPSVIFWLFLNILVFVIYYCLFSSHLLVRKNLISFCYHIAGITCKCTASTWYVQTVVGTIHVICSSWEVQFYSRPIWLVVTIEVIPSSTLGCWDEQSFLQNLHSMNSQSVSIWGLFLCFLASSCSYNPYHWTQRAWCLMGC